MITVDHIKSAIIGYWRSGAGLKQITEISGLDILKIIRIISDHEAKSNDNR